MTTFFVLVNIDDEIFANSTSGAADSSAELSFDEFWEIAARICNEKLPEEREGPFEQSLETWIGLDFLPRLAAAAKKRADGKKKA